MVENCIAQWTAQDGAVAAQVMPEDRRSVDVELDGLYDLTEIVIVLPPQGYYHYQIYASSDGENFYKIAYKNNNHPSAFEGDRYKTGDGQRTKSVCKVRVNISYSSASCATEYGAEPKEVQIYGRKVSEHIPAPGACTVPDFQDSGWSREYEKTAGDPEYAKKKVLAELSALTARVIGEEWRERFVFCLKNVGASKDKDAFSVESVEKNICICGRNGISLASGLNYYLKNYAHVNFNPLFVSQRKMPDELPRVSERVVKETPYDVRYALNFCTYSYTMAFWGWKEYETFLDWCAMNGVTILLDIVGQEEVQRRLLMKYGYSEAEVRDYITGPAYFAWFYMQNMSGFGGPLSARWFHERVELGRRIHDRMQTFGICPVLQGFAGMVPPNFGEKHPDADVMKQGLWCGFTRPDMLRTCGVASGKRDYFDSMAGDFYRIQKDVFGDITDYYAVDPFHEGGQVGDLDLSVAYHLIQTKMLESNPSAVWVLQQWQGQITEEKISYLAVPGQALILDLQSDLRSYADLMERKKVPWVWCMLHNFGGRMGMVGDVETLGREIPVRLRESNFMAGLGITPEAFGHTPIVYELLFDMAWTREPIDCTAYVKAYAKSRYGRLDEHMEHAWKTLLRTAYGKKHTYTQGAMESPIYARPCEHFTAASTWGHSIYEYDKTELESVLGDFIEAYDSYKDVAAYIYDMVDVTRQVLATSAIEYHRLMIQAYKADDLSGFQKYSGEFLEMIRLMDKVLACCSEYRVGKWLDEARNMYDGMDDWTKDLFELNARALITTWAGRRANNNGLQDYSNRQWAGVTKDYALARWEEFVKRYTYALENHTAPENVDYFWKEWEWANRKSDEVGDGYEKTSSNDDLKALANEVCERFALTKLDGYVEEKEENLALHKLMVCSLAGAPGYRLESLTDDDITTTWRAAEKGEAVFTVDLERLCEIRKIKFAMPPVAGDNAWDFKISVYDGADWVDIPVQQRETLLGTIEIPCKICGTKVCYTFTSKAGAPVVPTAEFAEFYVCGKEK